MMNGDARRIHWVDPLYFGYGPLEGEDLFVDDGLGALWGYLAWVHWKKCCM